MGLILLNAAPGGVGRARKLRVDICSQGLRWAQQQIIADLRVDRLDSMFSPRSMEISMTQTQRILINRKLVDNTAIPSSQ
jgi:hypothetical protein